MTMTVESTANLVPFPNVWSVPRPREMAVFRNAHDRAERRATGKCGLAHRYAAGVATTVDVITPLSVPGPYGPLHAYLSGRFADAVVLTFAEIEDRLGWALPDAPRAQPEWWTNDRRGNNPSPQSGAWRRAHRTASANVFARTVLFERVPD